MLFPLLGPGHTKSYGPIRCPLMRLGSQSACLADETSSILVGGALVTFLLVVSLKYA